MVVPAKERNHMEAEVYLDNTTGNMFVIRDGTLWSVNAVIVPGSKIRYFGGPNSGARIYHGRVIDWRWECGLGGRWDVRTGEVHAARYFGMEIEVKSMVTASATCKTNPTMV
jgi:hypothetical protein